MGRHRRDRKISDATIAHVRRRDQGCVAGLWLGAPDGCADRWGRPASPYDSWAWEFQHVNDFDLGRSVGTPDRVVILCGWHHQRSRLWLATSHGPEVREYVRRVEAGEPPRRAGIHARNPLTP